MRKSSSFRCGAAIVLATEKVGADVENATATACGAAISAVEPLATQQAQVLLLGTIAGVAVASGVGALSSLQPSEPAG